jgi:hypothetical protein
MVRFKIVVSYYAQLTCKFIAYILSYLSDAISSGLRIQLYNLMEKS